MLVFLAEVSETAGSVLSILLLVLVFGLPVYPAWKSAQKCVSKEDALLPCSLCKTDIPATARVCPNCGKAGGHDVFSKRGKKMYYNIKGNRFIRDYIWGLMVTLIGIPLLIIAIMELFR